MGDFRLLTLDVRSVEILHGLDQLVFQKKNLGKHLVEFGAQLADFPAALQAQRLAHGPAVAVADGVDVGVKQADGPDDAPQQQQKRQQQKAGKQHDRQCHIQEGSVQIGDGFPLVDGADDIEIGLGQEQADVVVPLGRNVYGSGAGNVKLAGVGADILLHLPGGGKIAPEGIQRLPAHAQKMPGGSAVLIQKQRAVRHEMRQIDRKKQAAGGLLRSAGKHIAAEYQKRRRRFVLGQKPRIHHAQALNAPAAAHPLPEIVQHGGGIDDRAVRLPAGDGNIRNIRVGGHEGEQNVGQTAHKAHRIFIQRFGQKGQHVAVGGQQTADIGHPQKQIVHAVRVGKAAVHGIAVVLFIQKAAYALIGGQAERGEGKGQQNDDPHKLCPNAATAHSKPPSVRLFVPGEAGRKRKGCFDSVPAGLAARSGQPSGEPGKRASRLCIDYNISDADLAICNNSA